MSLNVVSAAPHELKLSTPSACFECHSWLRGDGSCPVCTKQDSAPLLQPRNRPEQISHACPECAAEPPFAARVCPYCGYRFEERILVSQDRRTESAYGYRCSKCKSPLIEGGKFCATCGREFSDLGPPIPFQSVGDYPSEGSNLEQRRRQMLVNTFIQGSGFLVLAVSIVFVVLLCFR